MTLAKQLLGAIYYAKEIKLHELLIIDQLAKGVKPRINGKYDLREVEPSDHSMSRTYRDR